MNIFIPKNLFYLKLKLMKIFWILLIIFWIIVIIFPEVLAYLIWGFIIFIWINTLILAWLFSKSNSKEEYIKFWKYKIYR